MTHERSHNCTHRANFSLTCDAYDRLLDRADDRCEICRITRAEAKSFGWYLGIDHDRNAGWFFVRGLLCQRCNVDIQPIDRGNRDPDPITRAYLDQPFWRGMTLADFTKRGVSIVASALYWAWANQHGDADFGEWLATHDVLASADTLEQIIDRLYVVGERPRRLAVSTTGRCRP